MASKSLWKGLIISACVAAAGVMQPVASAALTTTQPATTQPAIVSATPACAPLTGAIFTSDRNGTLVNGNVYRDGCCEVFLNGGPPPHQPCSKGQNGPAAAGLPDGEYFFQVTDPSGQVRLSKDNIWRRRVCVSGGLIVKYLGQQARTCASESGPSEECTAVGHNIGKGKCQSVNPDNISVQLWPFDPTPNPGGVYKVWMTRIGDYNFADGVDDSVDPLSNFGFRESCSKTDNFKCGPSCDLTVTLNNICQFDPQSNANQLCAIVNGGSQLTYEWLCDGDKVHVPPDASCIIPSEPGRYSVTVTDGQTGCSDIATALVYANPVLDVDDICQVDGDGELKDLCATVDQDADVVWTDKDGAVVKTCPGLSAGTPCCMTPPAPGIYTATASAKHEDGNTCVSQKTGSVYQNPSCSIDTPAIAGKFTGTVSGGSGEYLTPCSAEFNVPGWVVDGCEVSGNAIRVDYHRTYGICSEAAPPIVTVTVTDTNNCKTKCSQQVACLEGCEVSAQSICEGQSTELTATPKGGLPEFTYLWSGPDGFTGTGPTVTTNKPGLYKVVSTDGNGLTATCCTAVVGISADGPTAACTGKTGLNYTALVDIPGGTFIPASPPTNAFEWSIAGDGKFCDGSTSAVTNPVCITVGLTGSFTLTITVRGLVRFNCEGNDAIIDFTATCEKTVPVKGGSICVKKFYDKNGNGADDDGMPLQGWKVILTGTDLEGNPVGPLTKFTEADGTACFNDLSRGTYTVAEALPGGKWQPTTTASYTVDLDDCDRPYGCSFGNACLGAAGGHTLGFWSNKNGQAVMSDGGSLAPELALLRSYHLRKDNGSDFDPFVYSQFRGWLLSATATNMSYMLSAQLAAMILNVEASNTTEGFVDGDSVVQVPGMGFMTVNELIAAADAALAADGLTLDGDPNRALQEALKTALDNANNNLNFVQAQPCDFSFP